jgi:hypothetical protein
VEHVSFSSIAFFVLYSIISLPFCRNLIRHAVATADTSAVQLIVIVHGNVIVAKLVTHTCSVVQIILLAVVTFALVTAIIVVVIPIVSIKFGLLTGPARQPGAAAAADTSAVQLVLEVVTDLIVAVVSHVLLLGVPSVIFLWSGLMEMLWS